MEEAPNNPIFSSEGAKRHRPTRSPAVQDRLRVGAGETSPTSSSVQATNRAPLLFWET